MINWLNNTKMKMDKAGSGEGGEGGTGASGHANPPAAPAPPAPTPNPTPTPPPAANPAGPQAEGDKFDELGYPIEKKPGEEKPPGEKPADPPKDPPKVKEPASGYDKEPEKVVEPPKPPEPPKDPPAQDDLDKAMEGVEEADKKPLKDYATKAKLTPDQLKELSALRIQENTAFKKLIDERKAENQRAIVKQRSDWYKELKEDKDFGGEKFDKSTANAERVLEEFFPNTKKELTKHKTMLPPYYMRDLAKLADHLYGSKIGLVSGDPQKPIEPENKTDDALAFYE